jgi:hypothetical protein
MHTLKLERSNLACSRTFVTVKSRVYKIVKFVMYYLVVLLFMMQVQRPSSSSRTLRSYSAKRARSPETTNPTDRPHKRLSLAVNDIFPAVVHSQTEFRSGWSGSGKSSRHHSEDWVHQAGGLTIDSPQAGDGSSFSSRPRDVEEDENMTVDGDEIEIENNRRLPGSPPHISQTNTSFLQLTTSNSAQYSSQQSSIDQHSSCPVPSHLALQLPSIDSNSPVGSESTQPITQPSPPTAMSISPTSPWNANTISTSSRKQRFTMGPRADCDKCLLGVKGHWMHLD